MSFLETVRAHRDGLVLLKTQLWWYTHQHWDNNPGRICIILDAHHGRYTPECALSARTYHAHHPPRRIAVRLLIDGSPCWIWVDEQDVELNFSLVNE